jgi:hypothetical protein
LPKAEPPIEIGTETPVIIFQLQQLPASEHDQ